FRGERCQSGIEECAGNFCHHWALYEKGHVSYHCDCTQGVRPEENTAYHPRNLSIPFPTLQPFHVALGTLLTEIRLKDLLHQSILNSVSLALSLCTDMEKQWTSKPNRDILHDTQVADLEPGPAKKPPEERLSHSYSAWESLAEGQSHSFFSSESSTEIHWIGGQVFLCQIHKNFPVIGKPLYSLDPNATDTGYYPGGYDIGS
ncbi:hypothetical protein Celaphus_00019469, partial [Cervus elaphus hippelaphus]